MVQFYYSRRATEEDVYHDNQWSSSFDERNKGKSQDPAPYRFEGVLFIDVPCVHGKVV